MQVTVEAAEDRIWIWSDYRDKEYVKLIPGVLWHKDRRLWHAPLAWSTCLILRGIFGSQLVVGPELTKWSIAEYEQRILPCLNLRSCVDAPGWGDPDLRPDQRVGVAALFTGQRFLLGDDMGTGKTVMGAEALELVYRAVPGLGPTLVICPNKVKRGWQRELAKWAPNLRVSVVSGTAAQRRKTIEAADYDVLVINWENLRNHSRLAPYGSTRLASCVVCDPVNSTRKHASCERCERELNDVAFSVVVADEVHRGKDPTAKQTRAWWAIAHQPSVVYSWGLTGTPIADAVDDLWSVMHGLAPREYPSKTAFVERYALQTWNAFGGMEIIGIRPERRDEFFGFFDPRFLRRPRAYSLAHVREPQRETRWAEMSAKQAKLYKEVADEMVARLDEGTLVVTNPLTQTTRLNQAAASYLEQVDCDRCGARGVDPSDPEAKCKACNGRGHRFFPTMPSNKIDDLIEFLGDLPKDEQVVVFAVSRRLIELTAAALDKHKPPITHVSITGKVGENQTHVNVAKFQAREARVCLVVIDAGGEGLDGLQCAQIGFFMQRHYSKLKNDQAEGRLVRGGQEGQTVIVDCRTPGTVEDDKDVILAEKAGRFEELVRDRETLRRLLSIRP